MRNALLNGSLDLDYPGTEAINTICSNMVFAGRNVKRVVVTSCDANDGKTFVAMQIALCMTRRGKRVVFVDADLRLSELRMRHHIQFDGNGDGLAHYLSGQCGMERIIYATNIPNFYLVPDGRDVQAPISLLTQPEFDQMMKQLSEMFDLVIIDTPPVGLVIDAAEIAEKCDGTIIVLEYNKTSKRALQDAYFQMTQSGTAILGCVLNKAEPRRLKVGSYYYHYGQGYYRKGYYRREKESTKKGIFGDRH